MASSALCAQAELREDIGDHLPSSPHHSHLATSNDKATANVYTQKSDNIKPIKSA